MITFQDTLQQPNQTGNAYQNSPKSTDLSLAGQPPANNFGNVFKPNSINIAPPPSTTQPDLLKQAGNAVINTGKDLIKGFTSDPGVGATSGNTTQSFGDFLANGTPAGEGVGLIAKGASLAGHGLSGLHALPAVAGLVKGGEKIVQDIAATKNVGKIVPETITPVQKIITALKEATPLRGKQEQLYSEARTKQAGALANVATKGEAGFVAQKGILKGELPKVDFTGIRNKISQNDINSLFTTIQDHPTLPPFQKVTAQNGLAKLLGQAGGQVPTTNEINLLTDVFGKDFTDTVLAKRSLLQKSLTTATDVLNLPKSLLSTGDLSAAFRQGIFAGPRHPKMFANAFVNQFKYMANQKNFDKLMTDIQSHPNYQLANDSGLALTRVDGTLGQKEEQFISNLAEKIPLFGRVVKASNRGYTGFLNKFRFDQFNDFVKNAQVLGKAGDAKYFKDAASFVNNVTGRGNLPGMLGEAAPLLNAGFFSPRLIASRLSLLNPVYYARLEPSVRKEALKTLLAFTTTGMSILGLAKMGGAQVGTDPRSADFGKIKVGNTRYDIWGGFQQYARLSAQMWTGQTVNSTTGKIYSLGQGYKPTTRLDIASRFAEGKLNPSIGIPIDILRGKDTMGQSVTPQDEAIKKTIPLVWQDWADLIKEQGLGKGTAMDIPSFFGVGTQTYGKGLGTQITAPLAKP